MVKYPKLVTIVDRERRTRTVLWGNLLLLFFLQKLQIFWVFCRVGVYIYIYKRKIYGAIKFNNIILRFSFCLRSLQGYFLFLVVRVYIYIYVYMQEVNLYFLRELRQVLLFSTNTSQKHQWVGINFLSFPFVLGWWVFVDEVISRVLFPFLRIFDVGYACFLYLLCLCDLNYNIFFLPLNSVYSVYLHILSWFS